jgi:hypothetical protein
MPKSAKQTACKFKQDDKISIGPENSLPWKHVTDMCQWAPFDNIFGPDEPKSESFRI